MSLFGGFFGAGGAKNSDHPIGKAINIGNTKVTIVKLLAEGSDEYLRGSEDRCSYYSLGGYGYVYLCKDGYERLYALKRLLVHDEVNSPL